MVNDASSRRTTVKRPISRSTKEALSKEPIQTASTSPTSNRKSELLEKRTPPKPPIESKSENKKLKMTPSPLRRSERNRNSSSPNPSLSNSGSPGLKKHVAPTLVVKKLDARGYRKAFKTQNRDYRQQSNSLDRSTSEEGSSGGGKIDECSKANSCKAIPKDVTLPPEDANAKDMCAESRLRSPEKELLENDATLDSTVPCNDTTPETSGAPERVQPDLHGKEAPQILGSNENLIRKCVGHDNAATHETSGVPERLPPDLHGKKAPQILGSNENLIRKCVGNDNAATHETSGVPERLPPDLHGKEVPQILASNENLIRKCVGHDNAATHETSGAPERLPPDLHGQEAPQILASNENLIRKCVGQDNVENMTSSKRKGTLVDKGYDISATLVDDDNCNVIVDAGSSRLCSNIVETSGPCSKRIRGVSLSGEQRDQRKFINDVDQTCLKSNDEKSSDRDEEGKYGDSVERPQGNNIETETIRKQQRSLHLSLKPEIAKLCEILRLPDNVKSMVGNFLEYTMNNYQICTEPVSILQAFQLSLCWTAASLLRHKLDLEASLMLAERHLNFECNKNVVNEIKAMLWGLKDKFLLLTGNSEVIQKASETSDTVHSKTEVIPNVELTEKDISKNIKETQKRKNQWRKLLLLQQEYKRKLEKSIETEKADFVRRSNIESTVIGKDKLTAFNIECVKRTKELERQHEVLLKDLEAMQLEARRKLQESWTLGESLRNKLGTPNNAPIVLRPDHVAEGMNDNKVEFLTRNGIGAGFSEPPNTNSSVVTLCSSPVELQSTLVKHTDVNELDILASKDRLEAGNKCHNISENEYDSQANMISEHSTSGDICDGGTSNVPNAEVAPVVHKTISSNDDSSSQGKLDGTISSEPVCALSAKAKVIGFIDGVKNMASSNSQSPEECVPSVSTTCRLYCKDAAQIHEADGRNASNNASTLNPPLSDENSESSQEHVMCMPKGQISAQVHEDDDGNGSNNVVTLKLPLNQERSGDGNVLDRDREVHVEMPNTANITPLSMQPLAPVESQPSPADILPANQTNHVLVEMPRTANITPLSVQPLSLLESLPSPADILPANQTNNVSMVMEPPEQVPSPADILPANQANHVSMVMEPPEQVQQLPSSGLLSSNRDLSNLHLVTRIEDRAATNEAALSSHIPVPEASTSLDDSHSRRVVPPASNLDLDSLMAVGVRAQSSDTRSFSIPRVMNNHPIQTAAQSTSQIIPPLYHDPLGHELERMRKRTEQQMKNHEDMKLQMARDFDKEFEELRRKYEIKYKELEGEFHEARKNQETILKLVYAHKILSDAFMAKYPQVFGTSTMQQDAGLSQLSYQLPRQQSASRPSLVTTPSPRGPPAASLQNSYATTGSATPSPRGPPAASLQNSYATTGSATPTPTPRGPPAASLQNSYATTGSSTPSPRGPPAASLQTVVRPPLAPRGPPTASLQTMARPPHMQAATGSQTVLRPPPMQATYNTSGIFSSDSARRPHINSISSPSGNLQAGGEIRAPAPHLQPYRPPTSVPVSSIHTAPNGMPSQIAPGNRPASSLASSQWLPRPTPTIPQSDTHRGHCHENTGGFSTPNMSDVNLRNVNSQSSINLSNALPRMSDLASLNPSNSGPSSIPAANSAHETTPTDVVCLSDDE